MRIGCRVFLIDDNDSLQRISIERLTRLLHFDRRISLQQYAGKRIRCAMIFLEVAGREVLSVRNIDYFLLPFDVKGQIDKKEWEKALRLGMELLSPILNEEHPKKELDGLAYEKERQEDIEEAYNAEKNVPRDFILCSCMCDPRDQGKQRSYCAA